MLSNEFGSGSTLFMGRHPAPFPGILAVASGLQTWERVFMGSTYVRFLVMRGRQKIITDRDQPNMV